MASINLDKSVALSIDPIGVLRMTVGKSDASTSFPDHFQRVSSKESSDGPLSPYDVPQPPQSPPIVRDKDSATAKGSADDREPKPAANDRADPPAAATSDPPAGPPPAQSAQQPAPPTKQAAPDEAKPAAANEAQPAQAHPQTNGRNKFQALAKATAKASRANKAAGANSHAAEGKAEGTEKAGDGTSIKAATDQTPTADAMQATVTTDAAVEVADPACQVDDASQKATLAAAPPQGPAEVGPKIFVKAVEDDPHAAAQAVAQAAPTEAPRAAEPVDAVEATAPKRDSAKGGAAASGNAKKNAGIDRQARDADPAQAVAAARVENQVDDSGDQADDKSRAEPKHRAATPVRPAAPGAATPAAAASNNASTPAVGSVSSNTGTVEGTQGRAAAHSTSPSGTSDVERVRFVQRVSRALQSAGDGNGSLRLRLSPPELGSVRVEVTIKDGTMSARLEAETPAAKAALLDSFLDLQNRLAEHEIKLDRFEVELTDRSGSGGSSGNVGSGAYSDRHDGSPPSRHKAKSGDTSDAPQAIAATRIVTADQLNVVI